MIGSIKLTIIIIVVSFLNPTTITFAQWEKIKSPEIKVPISTYTIANKGDTLFVGTYGSKIYRSTDGGINWTKSDSGISFLYWTYNFLITDSTVFSMGEEGIFRSTNMGESWESKDNGLPSALWQNVYEMVELDHFLFAATDFGVYKSSNNGDYWYPSNGDSAYWDIYSVAILDSLLFAGSAEHGVFRSTDKGITWDTVNIGLPYNSPNHYIRINKLYVDGKNIYAGTNQWGIYFSSDHGDTWLPDTQGLEDNSNGYFFPIYSISRIGNYLYAGTQDGGIFRQANPGDSWTQVNAGLPQYPYVISIISNGDKIFAATFNGLYYSSKDNIEWSPAFTEFTGNVDIRVIGSVGNKLYVKASSDYYNGTITRIFYSTNTGNTWLLDSVLNKTYIYGLKSFGDSLYSYGGGLFFSSNSGNNWTEIDSSAISSLIKDNDTLYTCYGFDNWQWGESGNISVSPDNGKSWKEIWTADTAVYAIEKIGNYLFAGGLHGVFRSTNTGSIWSAVNNGLPSNLDVYSFHKIDQNLFLSSQYHIYLSTDYGNNWSPADNGLPIDTLVYNPIHLLTHNNYLFAASANGIYSSSDLGKNWSNISDGLTGNALSANLLTVLGNNLVTATNDGLWQRPLSEITSTQNNYSDLPKFYFLSQNYPNPFNPLTTINYSIPKTGFVILKVYDLLGREIKTLVNEEKIPGNYKIEFDAANLSSGIYFYRLQAGSFTQTKKLILLK